MNYKILSLLILLIVSSCTITKNKTVYNERTNNDILIGKCNREAFTLPLFNEWFIEEYNKYDPIQSIISELKILSSEKALEIKIVFGTWCSDSRRELPRFYKLIDQINFNEKNIKLFAVDTNKDAGDSKLIDFDFSLIPTFVFFRNGKEIGRIVESTVKSLEEDMLEILKK